MRLFTDAGKQAMGLFESVIEIFFGGSQGGGTAPVAAPVTYHQQPEALAALAASRARRESRSGGSGYYVAMGGGGMGHSYAVGHAGTPSQTVTVFDPIGGTTTQGGSQSFGGIVTVQQQGSPITGYVNQAGHVSGAQPPDSPLTDAQEQQVLSHVTGQRGSGKTTLI